MLGIHSKQKTIESFEIVSLRTFGMRYAAEYEIVMKTNQAEVSEYAIIFMQGKDERRLERRAVVGEDEILNLLNACKVLSWDGFHGKHPVGVKDGTMFSFKATVNGGKTVCADGSQNFPKHYRDFTDALNKMLALGEET